MPSGIGVVELPPDSLYNLQLGVGDSQKGGALNHELLILVVPRLVPQQKDELGGLMIIPKANPSPRTQDIFGFEGFREHLYE